MSHRLFLYLYRSVWITLAFWSSCIFVGFLSGYLLANYQRDLEMEANYQLQLELIKNDNPPPNNITIEHPPLPQHLR
jgi:hypothetical protein